MARGEGRDHRGDPVGRRCGARGAARGLRALGRALVRDLPRRLPRGARLARAARGDGARVHVRPRRVVGRAVRRQGRGEGHVPHARRDGVRRDRRGAADRRRPPDASSPESCARRSASSTSRRRSSTWRSAPLDGVDGVSLVPALRGEETDDRDAWIVATDGGRVSQVALRRPPWKLTVHVESGEEEAYRLDRDPRERDSLPDEVPGELRESALRGARRARATRADSGGRGRGHLASDRSRLSVASGGDGQAGAGGEGAGARRHGRARPLRADGADPAVRGDAARALRGGGAARHDPHVHRPGGGRGRRDLVPRARTGRRRLEPPLPRPLPGLHRRRRRPAPRGDGPRRRRLRRQGRQPAPLRGQLLLERRARQHGAPRGGDRPRRAREGPRRGRDGLRRGRHARPGCRLREPQHRLAVGASAPRRRRAQRLCAVDAVQPAGGGRRRGARSRVRCRDVAARHDRHPRGARGGERGGRPRSLDEHALLPRARHVPLQPALEGRRLPRPRGDRRPAAARPADGGRGPRRRGGARGDRGRRRAARRGRRPGRARRPRSGGGAATR